MTFNTAHILDFFDWWSGELRSAWESLFAATKGLPPNWTIAFCDDGIRVHRKGAVEFQAPPLPLNASADEIAAAFGQQVKDRTARAALPIRAGSPTVAIEIREGLFLKRRLAARRLPVRQARAMAELDLLASTPLDPSQVHVLFGANAGQGTRAEAGEDVSYYVVKDKTLKPVLEALRPIGGNVVLFILDGAKRIAIDRLSMNAVRPRTAGRLRYRHAFAALLVAALCTYGHVEWRYRQANARLDEQIASMEGKAKEARALLNRRTAELAQIEKIRAERKASVSLVRTLADLTDLLPDSVWLTDLSIRQRDVTISGFAQSAADLIGPIEAAPLFAAPQFESPVTKVPGLEGERFTIAARIEPEP